MSLSRFIENSGRTLAYSPILANLFRDPNASLFLCQMLFWYGKGKLADDWIYKESKDITEETGLTYEQQRTARTKLKNWRLLEENRKRREGHIQYRVNVEQLKSMWDWIEERLGCTLANSTPEHLHELFLLFLETHQLSGPAKPDKAPKPANQ